MKLNRFKELDKKKRMILIGGISVILLIAVVLIYRTYAIYQEKQDFNVIKGSVPEYMSDYDVKLSLTIDGNMVSDFPNRESGKVFESAECDNGATGVWDYDKWAPLVLNTTKTRTKCKYHFVSKYSESILNGADPVLSDGLVPITIDNNGIVRKANESSEWYKYSDKVWANAVVLENENVVYQNGEVIPEENIESYFVWIPRYRYKIFNDGNYTSLTAVENKVQTIEVEFENKERSVSNGSKVGEWLTHPAFTSFNTNGIWVGKFETGYKGAKSTEEAQVNGGYASKVVIKPNVYSWRSIQVSNAFIASYDYQRGLDSHMMKNTEWASIAYLSHSKYGTQQRVRINNNGGYITGYASKSEPTCAHMGSNMECNKYESTSLGENGIYTINYNNDASLAASTTGNRSGIYDMSGGSWEYVMGVMVDKSGSPVSGRSDNENSNFIGSLTYPSAGTNKDKNNWMSADGGILFPDAKYYDEYTYGENIWDFNRSILGDAMGEMGPFGTYSNGVQNRQISSWYSNSSWLLDFRWPFVMRGGDVRDGLESGVFAFERYSGSMYHFVGFRITLAF